MGTYSDLHCVWDKYIFLDFPPYSSFRFVIKHLQVVKVQGENYLMTIGAQPFLQGVKDTSYSAGSDSQPVSQSSIG